MHRWASALWLAALLIGQEGLAAGATRAEEPSVNALSSAQRVTQRSPSTRNREAIWRAAREGIGALAPTLALPVTPAANLPFRELPLDPMPCDMQPAEGMQDASVQTASPDSGQNNAVTSPPDTNAAPLPVECAYLFPDIPPVPEQQYSFGLETLDPSMSNPVVVMTGGGASTRAWFSSVASQQGFSYSGGGWTYRDTVGPTISMGNLTANAPLWGSTVPIGGLQISSDWSGSQTLAEGTLAYSSAVGRLNYTDTSAAAGAIDYGVTAGSGSLRYGLTPSMTLESQMQSAPNMATHGLGTTYAAGDLGTFQVGATQSNFDHINAWRYRFGYNVNLTESISLAVTNEQIDEGFGDLSDYRSGSISAPTMRNTLAAGMPLHGWGTLTGTYTGTRESGTAVEQRFGLAHTMYIAPTVRFAVGADRDVVTGDYQMNLGISMPVDTFMRGRWLSR